LQFVLIIVEIVRHEEVYFGAIQRGQLSLVSFVGGLVYPGLLMLAGFSLFRMRRSALVLFGLYFAWAIAKLLLGLKGPGILDLIFILICVVYSATLYFGGELRGNRPEDQSGVGD